MIRARRSRTLLSEPWPDGVGALLSVQGRHPLGMQIDAFDMLIASLCCVDGVPATRNHLPDWDFRTDPAGNPVVLDGLHRAGHDAGVNDVLAPSCGRRPSRPPARSRGNTRLGCRLGALAPAWLNRQPRDALQWPCWERYRAAAHRCGQSRPAVCGGSPRPPHRAEQSHAKASCPAPPCGSWSVSGQMTRLRNVPGPRAAPSLGRSALLEIFPVVPWIGNLNVAARSLTPGSSTSPSATRPPAPTSRSSLGASQTQNGGNSSPNSRACAASG